MVRRLPFSIACFAMFAVAGSTRGDTPGAAGIELFEKQIRPILVERCYKCHSADAQSRNKLKGGLLLDSRVGIRRGGESGPAVVPGKVDESLLISALKHEEFEMPPDSKLPDRQVAAFERWIKLGAPDPRDGNRIVKKRTIDLEAGRRHWSFQPIRRPAVPAVEDKAWPGGAIDRFVQSRLEASGIAPTPPADRRTLIRRATFDLIGLPPTFAEVEAFVQDTSPDAFEKVVDRLLGNPHYGERWGRHWLDVARYSDTLGYLFARELRYPYAYTYRDYVVRALNEDKPFDRFVLEQLAADQLELGKDNSALAALGFLTVGSRAGKKLLMLDDRIDVVTRGLMGLTVTCARCHDHKYDPIPTADYYSLYGVFSSCEEPEELPLLEEPKQTPAYEAYLKKLGKVRQDLEEYDRKTHAKILADIRKLAAGYLIYLAETTPRHAIGKVRPRFGGKALRGGVIERWREHLAATAAGGDPIFTPWHEFAALDRQGFGPAAAARIRGWSESNTNAINARVLAALRSRVPQSMAEVGKIYGDLLSEVENHWQELLKKSAEGKHPARLADDAEEAIRQLLYADGAPASPDLAAAQNLLRPKEKNRRRNVFDKIKTLKADSSATPPRAMVLLDSKKPADVPILIRGDPARPGEIVPRRFLQVLSRPGRDERFKQGSGRLELARAIVSKDNPLTARVIANRVWQHHFGAGLVRTPSDFGTRGQRPTHPLLLDWLAAGLIEDGWSLKRLHRRIMLSKVYRQSSTHRSRAYQKDPENRLLWRQNRRRLEFEPMRDSVLHVAGKLDPRIGGKPFNLFQSSNTRRTLYAFVDRAYLMHLFQTFDFANPDTSIGMRNKTTVPQQSLFMLNSPFYAEQSKQLAARAAKLAGDVDPAVRIDALYRLVYSRRPKASELQWGLEFLRHEAPVPASAEKKKSKPDAWQQYAHVLLLGNEFVFID